MTMNHRVRGTVGTALTWAVGWGIGGTVFGAVTILTSPELRRSLRAVWMVFLGSTVGWSVTGAAAGVLFAAALLTAERRRTLFELAPARIAAWGALGGALLPLLGVSLSTANGMPMSLGALAAVVGLGASLGGACATLSLQLARRSPVDLAGDAARDQLMTGPPPFELMTRPRAVATDVGQGSSNATTASDLRA